MPVQVSLLLAAALAAVEFCSDWHNNNLRCKCCRSPLLLEKGNWQLKLNTGRVKLNQNYVLLVAWLATSDCHQFRTTAVWRSGRLMVSFLDSPTAQTVAGCCALASVLISLLNCYRHLQHYSKPNLQVWNSVLSR